MPVCTAPSARHQETLQQRHCACEALHYDDAPARPAALRLGASMPMIIPTHLVVMAACCLRTFFTIFCSSIRKARTMRWRTQLPQREPP